MSKTMIEQLNKERLTQMQNGESIIDRYNHAIVAYHEAKQHYNSLLAKKSYVIRENKDDEYGKLTEGKIQDILNSDKDIIGAMSKLTTATINYEVAKSNVHYYDSNCRMLCSVLNAMRACNE